MTNATPTHETDEEEPEDDHLADIEEGAGCTEIWEHLSEQRDDD
ncbi:hypothetical protein ACFQDG_13220 [Natronoarchaeum mannanilyticum]|uniref:Uncharacterized protein n=1 Tax=Natronoarchaeum mannanilyticum TaxID=926360 RepID=A0AAV3T648_9EURY